MNHRSERHFGLDNQYVGDDFPEPHMDDIPLPLNTWRPVVLFLAVFWLCVGLTIWSVMK